jgi:hypothetical protein
LTAVIKLRLLAEFHEPNAIGTGRNALARKTAEGLYRRSAPEAQQMADLLRKMIRVDSDFVRMMAGNENNIRKAHGDFLRDAGRRRLFFALLMAPPRRAAKVDAPAVAGMRRPSIKTSSSRRTLACQPGWSCR